MLPALEYHQSRRSRAKYYNKVLRSLKELSPFQFLSTVQTGRKLGTCVRAGSHWEAGCQHWGLAAGGVCASQLASSQHQDVFLLLMEAQLLPGQAGFIQLPLRGCQLPGKSPRAALLPVHPVHGHLVPYVIVQSTVGIVSQDLLVGMPGKTSHCMGYRVLSELQEHWEEDKALGMLLGIAGLTCREHCLSRMALRLPFQCSNWNTVISSWNSTRGSGIKCGMRGKCQEHVLG